MRTRLLVFTLLLLALALSACAGLATTPSDDSVLLGIYAAVASTLTAQAGSATPPEALMPTATPPLQASATPTTISTDTDTPAATEPLDDVASATATL